MLICFTSICRKAIHENLFSLIGSRLQNKALLTFKAKLLWNHILYFTCDLRKCIHFSSHKGSLRLPLVIFTKNTFRRKFLSTCIGIYNMHVIEKAVVSLRMLVTAQRRFLPFTEKNWIIYSLTSPLHTIKLTATSSVFSLNISS